MEQTQWNKPDLLELSGSYWKTFTLHTGVKLEIFTVLDGESLTAEAVTEKINGDLRGVRTLLNALTAMNLLEKDGDTYKNTPAASELLSKNSPDYTGFIIMHHHHLVDSWNRMSEAVLSGKPCRTSASNTPSETERESFLMGMFNIAMGLAPWITKGIDLSGRKRLLDFGGGPGTYAIHFCIHNPELKASVFDLPTTRKFAEKTINRFSLSDRVDFIDGSFHDDSIDLGHRFDAAWLSHILHGEGPDDAEKIVRHAVSALEPGGLIMIHEFILNNNMASPLFPTLFSINMLVGTEDGQAYSEEQLMGMLERNGVTDIRRMPINGPTPTGIVCGIVK